MPMPPPAAPTRAEAIAAQRAAAGGVAAVLPVHDPRALLRAFGLLPVEVWGPPRVDASRGAAHLQAYVCSVVRNALSFLLAGGLDVADVIVVPHACDSLQGLGSILLDFVKPRQQVLPLYLPRGGAPGDVRFLADELRSLYRKLERAIGVSPPEGELKTCIAREEVADGLLAELHRNGARLAMTQRERYRLIRSREYLPAESFSELARVALAPDCGEPKEGGVPVVLSGIVPEPMRLFDAIAGMGGVVVADDLACCGRRLYPPGTSDDPFEHMAESILAAPPDPMRGSPIRDRVAHVSRLARASGARGVIFYDVKFCDPELFDLPILRSALAAAGLPSVAIEIDLNDPLSGQVATRLEAFLEMVA